MRGHPSPPARQPCRQPDSMRDVVLPGASRRTVTLGDITEPCNIPWQTRVFAKIPYRSAASQSLPDPRRRPFKRRIANSLNQKNRITKETFPGDGHGKKGKGPTSRREGRRWHQRDVTAIAPKIRGVAQHWEALKHRGTLDIQVHKGKT